MTIGVISDTHGDRAAMRRVLKAAGEVDAWIHLGDNTADAGFIETSGAAVYSVAGNCDLFGEQELTVAISGARIFITHGHLYGVGFSTDRLAYRAMELNCAAALFGHTHIQHLDEGGEVLLLNPGSPSRPRGGSGAGYALLYVDEYGGVDADLFTI